MIDKYLRCRHVFGGRGPDEYDCWGQVRDVRANVFGLPWLPSYGAVGDGDKEALTEACLRESRNFNIVEPCPAAIATVWKSRLCVHVGVCVEIDGKLGVLDTNPGIGPQWKTIREFERKYLKVVYYHDA